MRLVGFADALGTLLRLFREPAQHALEHDAVERNDRVPVGDAEETSRAKRGGHGQARRGRLR